MSILALHEGQAAAAAPDYIAPPKPEPKFNAWGVATAVPRGMAEAGMQVLGSVADIGAGLAYYRDTPTKDMQAGIPAEAFSSDLGESLRARGREFRPDPLTASTAEELLFGFARGESKIVGGAMAAGPLGVAVAGAEEAMTQSDELRRQGVGLEARNKAGMVQGAGLGLAALPLVGQTLKATAALYVAGGPGGFMAQQALTREILRNAGQDQIAAQFDPFDPVGLAVASLIPAGFAAWGIRGQRMAAAAKAAEDFRTGPVPSDVAPVAAAVRQAYSPEVVDAARVVFATEQRAASNLGDATAHADAHEAALAKAEDQMARGEPVQVSDVAPRLAVDSVLAEQASALRDTRGEGQRFHGTSRPIAGLSDEYAMVGDSRNVYGAGFYTTDAVDIAAGYSKKGRGKQPSLYAVDVQPGVKLFDMDQPLTDELRATLRSVVGSADFEGADSLITQAKTLRGWFDEFRAESRNFDLSRDDVHEIWDALRTNLEAEGFRGYKHTGGDKTGNRPHEVQILWAPEQDAGLRRDDFAAYRLNQFGASVDALRAALRRATQESARAAEPTKAANPEATAPRSDAAAPAGVPGARPAAAEAAGLTPGASAETSAAAARIEGIRAQHPGLMVQIDGMDAPMRMDDFLAAVKAEADELAADAPLMEVAAQCALLNGP